MFVLFDAPPAGRLDSYDTQTLRRLYSTPLPSPGRATTSSAASGAAAPLAEDALDDRLIVGHLWQAVASIVDAKSGHVLATLPVGSSPGSALVDVPSITVDQRVHRAYMLLPTMGTLTTLDVQRLRIVQTVQVGVEPAAPLVDARTERVIVASLGAVSVVDARSGALVRTIRSGQTIAQYPVAIDGRSGMVYVAGLTGQSVTSVEGTSGRLRRSTTVPGDPEAIAVDPTTDRVLVVVGHQAGALQASVASPTVLCVLDGATGHLRHVVPLTASSAARLYLDGRTQRALVLLDGSTDMTQPDPWWWIPRWVRRRLPLGPVPPTVQHIAGTRIVVVNISGL